MMSLWKRSLAAQLVSFLLTALVVSQGLTFLIYWQDHSKALDDAAKSEFFSRARTMTLLMETMPAPFREQALLASETRDSRFWVTREEARDPAAWRQSAVQQFARPLDNFVDLGQFFNGGPAAQQLPDAQAVAAKNVGEDWEVPFQSLWALPQPVHYVYFEGTRGYGLVIRLDDGSWLNAAFYLRETGGWWTSTSLASLGLTALVLALIAVLSANHIARPLRHLARSAEALGRGENLPPLVEEGPTEVRRTAEAFNQMQDRLQRFVQDRTKMLAAIGHDLRTPLTTLRLRAEFVEDREVQSRMLSTIDEMRGMTEAAIAFARGETADEPTREIQLDALVGSVCDDLQDLGYPVSFDDSPAIDYRCRPNSLRRALRNLVENAVRYGGEAKVSIGQSTTIVEIVVEDRGPGIPEAMKEAVFTPFFRLEASRNRDTGGIGLGLSIARSAVRRHGGDILLVNGAGGMCAIIALPRTGDAPTKVLRARRFGRARGGAPQPANRIVGHGVG